MYAPAIVIKVDLRKSTVILLNYSLLTLIILLTEKFAIKKTLTKNALNSFLWKSTPYAPVIIIKVELIKLSVTGKLQVSC